MTNIELKKSLRAKIKAALKNLPPQDVLKKRCDEACLKICATEQFISSEYVFVYMNMKNEADCSKVLNYSITYIDNGKPQEELPITKLNAIERYIELLKEHKYSHIDKGIPSTISELKIYKVTTKGAIDITGNVNKFLA